MGIILLAANLIVNIAYLVTFQIQIDDYQFNQYKKYHKPTFTFIVGFSLIISLHLFRLLFCKLFALPIFYA